MSSFSEPKYPDIKCVFQDAKGVQCVNDAEFGRFWECLCDEHQNQLSRDEQIERCIVWRKQKYNQSDKIATLAQVEKAIRDSIRFAFGQEEFIPRGIDVFINKDTHFVFPDGQKYVVKLIPEN